MADYIEAAAVERCISSEIFDPFRQARELIEEFNRLVNQVVCDNEFLKNQKSEPVLSAPFNQQGPELKELQKQSQSFLQRLWNEKRISCETAQTVLQNLHAAINPEFFELGFGGDYYQEIVRATAEALGVECDFS